MNELICCNRAFTGKMNIDWLKIFLHELRQTNPSWIMCFKSKNVKGSLCYCFPEVIKRQ